MASLTMNDKRSTITILDDDHATMSSSRRRLDDKFFSSRLLEGPSWLSSTNRMLCFCEQRLLLGRRSPDDPPRRAPPKRKRLTGDHNKPFSNKLFIGRPVHRSYFFFFILVTIWLCLSTTTTTNVHHGYIPFRIASVSATSSPSSSSPDPYRLLGVKRSANDIEIKKAFRSLALKYHPDKYHHKSSSKDERLKAETKFKQIQHAYEQIGTAAARRKYHFESTYGTNANVNYNDNNTNGFGRASASSPYGTDPVSEAFFQFFESPLNNHHHRRYSRRPRSSSFPNAGFRATFTTTTPWGSPMFSSTTTTTNDSSNNNMMSPAQLSFKSIYLQKVPIPLHELYNGITKYRFYLEENIVTRWRAAIRGKIWLLSFYQGILYSIPAFRMVRNSVFALCVGLFVFHGTLPRPDPTKIYESKIRKGLKGGSNIKFTSTIFGQPEVIFEIVEQDHPYYERIDNDLHTTVTITLDEARSGCTKVLPPLDPTKSASTTTNRNSQHSGRSQTKTRNDNNNTTPITLKIPPMGKRYGIRRRKRRRWNRRRTKNRSSSSTDTTGGDDKDDDTTTRIFRVHGRGWPILLPNDTYRYGDIVVTVNIVDK